MDQNKVCQLKIILRFRVGLEFTKLTKLCSENVFLMFYFGCGNVIWNIPKKR